MQGSRGVLPAVRNPGLAGSPFDMRTKGDPASSGRGTARGVSRCVRAHGYFVFGTTDHYVKFLVLATIDLDVDWP
jgi:hypothetical protein